MIENSHPLFDYWQALKDSPSRFFNKDGMKRASYVAMSMMLAIFPFCILALSIAVMLSVGQITHNFGSMDDLLHVVFGSWPDEIAQPIESEVRAVLEASGGTTATFGALLTLLLASNGFEAVRDVICEAYHENDPHPLWQRRLLAVLFAIGGAILVTLAGIVGVLVPAYLKYASDLAPVLHLEIVKHEMIASVVTVGFLFFGLIAVHKWLPGLKRPIKDILPGVLLTMVLWALGATAFDFYIQKFSNYSVTYAGLAGVMTALIFLYLMAAVFVFGAEYNARLGELVRQRRQSKTPSE
ncbi:YihY/virulence factor BrkB family protein [Shimia thalassica]|uniref:YihY/virulence factor BrkB family protein n=1 Tax=Shimia thalassica TaxID=1715693 RepID=UPI0026E4743B|nr:YihY/virulence factor BrkB family protein [Shimia thalassica]MDO6478013.1 YihY/virulence factor BrkB family protein [Shimia thalassica]